MSADELLRRYLRLRSISARHHDGALDCLARTALLDQARHLGLAHGRTLLAENEQEMVLMFDLAIHTAKPGRSRAIDRYARAASLAPGSDEARVLEAMRQARFSIWRVGGRHETMGVMVTDMMREGEAWLLDQGIAASLKPGMMIASRLCWPEAFAMTCGVVVPIDAALLVEIMLDPVVGVRLDDDHATAADHPAFATAVYREAIRSGAMERVVFKPAALAA